MERERHRDTIPLPSVIMIVIQQKIEVRHVPQQTACVRPDGGACGVCDVRAGPTEPKGRVDIFVLSVHIGSQEFKADPNKAFVFSGVLVVLFRP